MNEKQAEQERRAEWLRFEARPTVPAFDVGDIGELAALTRKELDTLRARVAALEPSQPPIGAPDRTNAELYIWAEGLREEFAKSRRREFAEVAQELDNAKSLIAAVRKALDLDPTASPVDLVGRVADLRQQIDALEARPTAEQYRALQHWTEKLISEKDALSARIVASGGRDRARGAAHDEEEPEEGEEEEDDDDGPTPLEALEVMTARAEKAERQGRADAASIEALKRDVKALHEQQAVLTRSIQERERAHVDNLRQASNERAALRAQLERVNSVALALQRSSIAVLPTGRLLQELEKRVPVILVNDPARIGLVIGMITELERTCALFAQHGATVEAVRKAQDEIAAQALAKPPGFGASPPVRSCGHDDTHAGCQDCEAFDEWRAKWSVRSSEGT
jgi:BMFP domain-containing protein YqiC